jgi:hypothetical protein
MDYANLHRLNHIGEWSEVMVNNKIHIHRQEHKIKNLPTDHSLLTIHHERQPL